MGGLSPWHWLILVLVVVVLFGAKRLPDAARSIGKSMKIFKAETKDMRDPGDSDGAGDSAATTGPDAKQLSTAPQPDQDQQIAELQRQLDELKKHQPSSESTPDA